MIRLQRLLSLEEAAHKFVKGYSELATYEVTKKVENRVGRWGRAANLMTLEGPSPENRQDVTCVPDAR